MRPLSEVLNQVEAAYTGLRETARLVLAVTAATRLDREQPLAVILVGGPSSGKTSLLMPLTKGAPDTALRDGVLRVDDFTPASLVSHAANKSPEQLEKIDLLPKMRGKCVIVKEMAPIFTGHEDDLLKKFGIFASILDGEGHVSGSGSYGMRGYADKITFSLIGAVTSEVLTPKVYKSLRAVGPRFCFWEMPDRGIDNETWLGPKRDRKKVEAECADAIRSFLEELFTEVPSGTIGREYFEISDQHQATLSHIAVLMANLRSKVSSERDEDGGLLPPTISRESPERAFRYLEQIVFGSALIDGRAQITNDDLKLALGIALGSSAPRLGGMAKLFFRAPQARTNHDLSVYLGLGDDSASKYVCQLAELGCVEKVNKDGTTEWDLKRPFKALRELVWPESRVSQEDAARAVGPVVLMEPDFFEFEPGGINS